MKKIIVLLFVVFTSGCLFPAAMSMRGVVTSVDDYSVDIVSECDATRIGDVMPDVASIFIEFGCDSCLVAEFKGDNGSYTVELVSFLKSKGATGAYLSSDIPGAEPLDIGFMGRKSDTAIEFLKGRHLVLIRPKSGGSMEEALKLAYRLEKMIPGDTIKPDVFAPLPKSQKEANSEFYFAGPKTFALGFSPDLAEALSLGGAVDGNAAEYNIDGNKVVFIMVKYAGRRRTLTAMNAYIDTRKDRPIIQPRESLQYYTIIEPDRTETYIAENGDWLHLMLNSPRGGKPQEFFEYIIRGGR